MHLHQLCLSSSPIVGDHGYDNSLPSMHPFLAATGPSFRKGYSLRSMQSVDVYPLMCRLLSVPAQPNNGSLTQARCLLAAETCWDISLVIGLVVGVLLILTAITGKYEYLPFYWFVVKTNVFAPFVPSLATCVYWICKVTEFVSPQFCSSL